MLSEMLLHELRRTIQQLSKAAACLQPQQASSSSSSPTDAHAPLALASYKSSRVDAPSAIMVKNCCQLDFEFGQVLA